MKNIKGNSRMKKVRVKVKAYTAVRYKVKPKTHKKK